MNHKSTEFYFFLILFFAIFGITLFIFAPYFKVIVLAGALAVVFSPFYYRISRFFGERESLAAFLTIILVIIIIFTPLVILGFKIFEEANYAYGIVANGGNADWTARIPVSFQHYIQKISPNFSLDFSGYLKYGLDWLMKNLGTIFSGFADILFMIFLILLALYYLLKDGSKFKQSLITLSPLADVHDEEIISKLRLTASSVIKGSLLMAVIQGLLSGIGFLIFGVPQAALLGLLAVIAALVPILGNFITFAPIIFYLFITGKTFAAIGLSVWGILIVGLADNLLRPKLIERGMRIHPLLILFSVLGGISVFGPIGFLVGPLIISLFFSLLDIYSSLVLEQENLH